MYTVGDVLIILRIDPAYGFVPLLTVPEAPSAPYFRQASRDFPDAQADPSTRDDSVSDYSNILSVYPFLTIHKIQEYLDWQTGASREEALTILLTQIRICSEEVWDVPTDVHEYRSRLRYYVLDKVSNKLELASEWVRIFELRRDYLWLAPPEVQAKYAAIQTAKKNSKVVQPSLVTWILERITSDIANWNNPFMGSNQGPSASSSSPDSFSAAASPTRRNVNLTGSPSVMTNTKSPRDATDDGRKRRCTAREGSGTADSSPPRSRKRAARKVLEKNISHMALSHVWTVNPTTSISSSTATAIPQPHPQATQLVVPMFALVLAPVPALVVQPSRNGRRDGLRPEDGASSWNYEWSKGRKRAWLRLSHLGQQLPEIAYVDYWSAYVSKCTAESPDIRLLGGIHITMVELIVVSHAVQRLLVHDTNFALLSSSPNTTSGRPLALASALLAGPRPRSANSL
jgi:hypothetical protein